MVPSDQVQCNHVSSLKCTRPRLRTHGISVLYSSPSEDTLCPNSNLFENARSGVLPLINLLKLQFFMLEACPSEHKWDSSVVLVPVWGHTVSSDGDEYTLNKIHGCTVHVQPKTCKKNSAPPCLFNVHRSPPCLFNVAPTKIEEKKRRIKIQNLLLEIETRKGT